MMNFLASGAGALSSPPPLIRIRALSPTHWPAKADPERDNERRKLAKCILPADRLTKDLEALGLGSKCLAGWLEGAFYTSRSVCQP
jgi:hypothetical protein